MDKSISLSNSPSPIKKTGNSQRAFDLCGELYSLVQQWNLLIATGKLIIKKIINLKISSWENKESHDCRMLLEEQCNNLEKLVEELGMLPKNMEKIRDQYTALGKLEEFQQQRMTSPNDEDIHATLFLTWPTSKFVAVASSIQNAFTEEFLLKKCIAENVAHCEHRQQLDFHQIAWTHKVFVNSSVQLELESMLVETGQR